jgi:hypothetical protein
MQWNRSNVLGLAKASCFACGGLGMRISRNDTEVPCNCVLRAIFRACYNRFRTSAQTAEHIGSVGLEFSPGKEGRRTYGRRYEEFSADFCLVSKRHLEPFEYQIFKYHFLYGADWKLCTRQLKIERGRFFHYVYRIEEKLGRVFAALQPYALYPVNEYFAGTIRRGSLLMMETEQEDDLEDQIAA